MRTVYAVWKDDLDDCNTFRLFKTFEDAEKCAEKLIKETEYGDFNNRGRKFDSSTLIGNDGSHDIFIEKVEIK